MQIGTYDNLEKKKKKEKSLSLVSHRFSNYASQLERILEMTSSFAFDSHETR